MQSPRWRKCVYHQTSTTRGYRAGLHWSGDSNSLIAVGTTISWWKNKRRFLSKITTRKWQRQSEIRVSQDSQSCILRGRWTVQTTWFTLDTTSCRASFAMKETLTISNLIKFKWVRAAAKLTTTATPKCHDQTGLVLTKASRTRIVQSKIKVTCTNRSRTCLESF